MEDIITSIPPTRPQHDKQQILLDAGWRHYTDDILGDEFLIPPPVQLEFVPHKDAPLFDDINEGKALLHHVMQNWEATLASPEGVDIIRQCGLVSLWFFLKYIASFSGPYADLTDHLHIDMANFRQKQLHAGARGAVFVPRSMYKSTVMTHGAITWELIRDPNLRVGMCSSKAEMSEQFMHVVQKNFENNDLIRFLWPNHCPKRDPDSGAITQDNWTKKKMTMPNCTIDAPEGSIKPIGALASAQGNHFDLLAVDDIVGEKQLNAAHGVSDEMIKIGNWFNSNQDTLLVSPKYSRVFVAATRYAVDDPYDLIFTQCKHREGYWDELPYVLEPDGIWNVYYRMAIEQNNCIFPEKVDEKFLERLRINNPWSYFTQYLNNPFDAQTNEFKDYTIKECELDYSASRGIEICYFTAGEHRRIPLAECEVNIGIDPSASERSSSKQRNSRTAIVVVARDCNDKRFYIDGFADYTMPSVFYDRLFALYNKYKNYVDNTCLEAHGPFKIVLNTLREEQQKRKTYLNLRRISPLPDKDAKIRNFIQPLLDAGLVYAAHPIRQYIEEEITIFPGGSKEDTLDAMEIADRFSIKPLSTSEYEVEKNQEIQYRSKITNRAGY